MRQLGDEKRVRKAKISNRSADSPKFKRLGPKLWFLFGGSSDLFAKKSFCSCDHQIIGKLDNQT